MSFGSLALVVAVGLMGPLLGSIRRFGPPVVVGQIVGGLVVGSGGLKWVDPTDPFLTGLAQVGFALLMFIVGTHLPVRDRRIRGALAVGAAITATVVALSAAAGWVLAPFVGLDRPWLLAVLIATSSGAVALPVLQNAGREDRTALVLIGWIAIADVVTVVALPAVVSSGSVLRVAVGGVIVVSAGACLYGLARIARGRGVIDQLRSMSRTRGWGLDLRVSLVALFLCAWVATRFGTSVMIAGFTVGAVVAMLGEPRRVADQLVGVGEGFVVPLFFVHLGTQLDPAALLRSASAIKLAVGLAVAAIVVHLIAAVVWRLPIGAGLLATAQLGVPAAAVSIGLTSGLINAAQGAGVMAAVLVSLAACSVGGLMLGHVGPLTDAAAPVATT